MKKISDSEAIAAVENFLNAIFDDVEFISMDMEVNDDCGPAGKAVAVEFKNTTNKSKAEAMLFVRHNGSLQLLKGDEFYDTNHVDFLRQMFLEQFLTFNH